MWGESASDLWGRLEQEEEREVELLDAVRLRLQGSTAEADAEELRPPVDLEAA